MFSESESGCCNQKSFMRHAFPALQIQLFFDGDTANYESTDHALEIWQHNEVFLLVNFMHKSGLKRSRMIPPEKKCLNLIFSTTSLS